MPTTIEVNKQSVEALLGSGKSKPFVIPEYQRPYAWTDEQVETLFEDLWDFTATSGGTERESSYFLGNRSFRFLSVFDFQILINNIKSI